MEHGSFSRIESAEVNIKISSTVVNIQTLKYAELVLRRSSRGVWNIVLDWTKPLDRTPI
jgi:hypothetical protein